MSIPELSPVAWVVSGVVFLLAVVLVGSLLILHAENPQPVDDLTTDDEDDAPHGVAVTGASFAPNDDVLIPATVTRVFAADGQIEVMVRGDHLILCDFDEVEAA